MRMDSYAHRQLPFRFPAGIHLRRPSYRGAPRRRLAMCAYPFHTMDESPRSNPLLNLIVIFALVGGAVYFALNFKVEGLDGLKIHPKSEPIANTDDESLDDLLFVSAAERRQTPESYVARPSAGTRTPGGGNDVRNIRIGSWALSGFGPSKLAHDECRLNLIRTIGKFDVIALQQISASERDLVPRLVDEINEGGRVYDFVLGDPGGPPERSEQLAILFNVNRVRIDRTQTYTVADPQNQMTYDPLVAWFRAAEPAEDAAWTFSLVNVRINLSRAPAEVALLPGVFSSVRLDGRGEDDVVLAGLMQADDSYLIKRVMGENIAASVRSTTTDIFHRHQTCNLLIDRHRTSEFIGRGGPVDFLRLFNLTLGQAESVSSHLPVFAEFTAIEGDAI